MLHAIVSAQILFLRCDGDPDGLYSICTHETKVWPQGENMSELVTEERGWYLWDNLFLCPSCVAQQTEGLIPLRWRLKPDDLVDERLARGSCFVPMNRDNLKLEK